MCSLLLDSSLHLYQNNQIHLLQFILSHLSDSSLHFSHSVIIYLPQSVLYNVLYSIYAAYNTLPLVVKVDPAVIHEEDYFQRLENLVEKTKEKRGYNELKVSVDFRF